MSSEELLRKKVRGAHRASVTRLLGQVDGLTRATPADIDELTLCEANLTAKLTQLQALDAEILDEGQLEDEVGASDEYAEKIRRGLLATRKAMRMAKMPSPPLTSRSTRTSPPLVESRPAALTDATASGKVKLPKISLPHFKGNLINWTAFWDSYVWWPIRSPAAACRSTVCRSAAAHFRSATAHLPISSQFCYSSDMHVCGAAHVLLILWGSIWLCAMADQVEKMELNGEWN